MFNLKNKKCQEVFKKETSKNNNHSKVFIEEDDVATDKFMKKLNKLLHKCFQKVTVKNYRESENEDKLYSRWNYLKNKGDAESVAEFEEVEEQLSEEFFNKVKTASKDVDCAEGGNITAEIWKLKKQLCPQSRDPPTAMMDEDGNLVTNVETIKDMAAKAYKHRLRNRPIKKGMEDMTKTKEKVALKVMEAASNNKTDPWDMDDLDIVLNKLKKTINQETHMG